MPDTRTATTEQLLQILSDGNFHSGNELGEQLNVSRTAVWKHLHQLERNYSIKINAIKGKGYQLASQIDLIKPNKVLDSLRDFDNKLVRQLHSFTELESTNQWLIDQYPAESIHAVICHAEFQSAGRGRRQKTWQSPLGCNLYFSLGWQFELQLAALGTLSLVVGIALVEVLHATGLSKAGLKWPNDIYVDNKKLAGILIELRGEANAPATAIIGIGINIDMPDEQGMAIDQAWTDMTRQNIHIESRNRFLAMCINNITRKLVIYDAISSDELLKLWHPYDILYNQNVVIDTGQSTYTAVAKGINADGSLKLDINGTIQALHAGDVSLKLAQD